MRCPSKSTQQSLRRVLHVIAVVVAGYAAVSCGDDAQSRPAPPSPAANTPVAPCANLPGAPGDRAPQPAKLLVTVTPPNAVGLGATHVYFSVIDGTDNGALYAIPKLGGSLRLLFPVLARRIVVQGDKLYASDSRYVWEIPTDQDDLRVDDPRVKRIAAANSEFDVHEGVIYFTSQGSERGQTGVFRQVPGLPPSTLWLGLAARGLSLRDGYVYFGNRANGEVLRVPMNGGPQEVLFAVERDVERVFVGCSHVFATWGAYGGVTAAWALAPTEGRLRPLFANTGGLMVGDSAALYLPGPRRLSLATGQIASLLPPTPYNAYSREVTIAVDDDAVYFASALGLMRAAK